MNGKGIISPFLCRSFPCLHFHRPGRAFPCALVFSGSGLTGDCARAFNPNHPGPSAGIPLTPEGIPSTSEGFKAFLFPFSELRQAFRRSEKQKRNVGEPSVPPKRKKETPVSLPSLRKAKKKLRRTFRRSENRKRNSGRPSVPPKFKKEIPKTHSLPTPEGISFPADPAKFSRQPIVPNGNQSNTALFAFVSGANPTLARWHW